MRLADSEYLSRPWRLHEIAADFEVEDVWQLPTPGGPDDLARLVRSFALGDGSAIRGGGIVGFLFAVRWKLGAVLGWDAPGSGLGDRVHSIRERLPRDLSDGPRGPDVTTVPFTSVFLTHDEWVAESANATVHALIHIGWVPDEAGVFRAQMTALVRPNGRGGRLYLALIAPLRRAVVYPRMLRAIGRRWQATTAS
jgi:uncharacterized protein DUF2867